MTLRYATRDCQFGARDPRVLAEAEEVIAQSSANSISGAPCNARSRGSFAGCHRSVSNTETLYRPLSGCGPRLPRRGELPGAWPRRAFPAMGTMRAVPHIRSLWMRRAALKRRCQTLQQRFDPTRGDAGTDSVETIPLEATAGGRPCGRTTPPPQSDVSSGTVRPSRAAGRRDRTSVPFRGDSVHSGRAPGSDRRARRARTQPQGRYRRVPA